MTRLNIAPNATFRAMPCRVMPLVQAARMALDEQATRAAYARRMAMQKTIGAAMMGAALGLALFGAACFLGLI
jgi:hypothetical protein